MGSSMPSATCARDATGTLLAIATSVAMSPSGVLPVSPARRSSTELEAWYCLAVTAVSATPPRMPTSRQMKMVLHDLRSACHSVRTSSS